MRLVRLALLSILVGAVLLTAPDTASAQAEISARSTMTEQALRAIVSESARAGEIDPEHVVTPGIFVDHIVEVSDPLHESRLIAEGRRYP